MAKRKQYEIDFRIGAVITPEMRKAFISAQKQVEQLSKTKSISNGVATGIAKVAAVATVAQKGLEFGKDVIQSAIDYESKLADVKKVVDELSDSVNMANFKNEISEMTKILPMTSGEILDIATSAGQAGIAFEEITKFTEDAGKMGIAFDTTAEQAGEWMSQWRNSFKMTQDEVNELSDIINYLSNTSGATAIKISEVVTKIGPLGDVAGVSSNKIAALATSMISAGVQEDVAATGIKNLMLNLNKGAAATGNQQKALLKLGLTATQVAKDMQKDSEGTIVSVFERISKLNDSEQTSVLQQIFGTESVAAIAPLLSNLDYLKDQFYKVGDAENYAGSMQAEFETRSATTENKIQLAENAMERLKIKLGEGLLPIVGKAAEGFANFLDSEGIQNTLNSISGKISQVMPYIVGTIETLQPILEGIISAFSEIAKEVTPLLSQIFKVGKSIMDALIPPILNIISIVQPIIQKILPPIIGLIQRLTPLISLLAQVVGYALSSIIEKTGPIINTIVSVVSNMINVFDGIIDFIANVFSGNWEAVWENVKTIFSNIWNSLVEILKLPVNAIIGLMNQVINGINSLSVTLPDWGFLGDLAGKTFSPNLPNIPELATGGKVLDNGAYLAGEKGPELITNTPGATVIRNSKTQDILSNLRGTKSEESEKIIYNPTFIIQGNADKKELQEVSNMGLTEFEKLYDKLLAKRNRLKYA